MNLPAAALEFAHNSHRGQSREGDAGIPYLHHPLEVASLLFQIGGVADHEDIAAAILHDTIEEGGISQNDIEEKFGRVISHLVGELTRAEPSEDQAQVLTKIELYELRTNLLLAGIKVMSPRAQRIKLADRLSNWREAKAVRRTKKLARYGRQTLAILEVIPRSVCPPLWDTLKEECSNT